MKIYIAGPMRGKPDWNIAAFDRAEALLKGKGYDVINPARWDKNAELTQDMDTTPDEFDPDNVKSHKDANRKIMKADLDVICDSCDAIYMLKGWQQSQGACAEFYLSCSIGLDVFYE